MPLDLSLIFYDARSSKKLSSLTFAIEQAGHTVPDRVSNFHTLLGHFKCIDCPESERRDMPWYSAKMHICETTHYREMQEDGEMELKSRKHKRLEYIVEQEPAAGQEEEN
jgi:hypothetical protein